MKVTKKLQKMKKSKANFKYYISTNNNVISNDNEKVKEEINIKRIIIKKS